jgi:hypothetical protein
VKNWSLHHQSWNRSFSSHLLMGIWWLKLDESWYLECLVPEFCKFVNPCFLQKFFCETNFHSLVLFDFGWSGTFFPTVEQVYVVKPSASPRRNSNMGTTMFNGADVGQSGIGLWCLPFSQDDWVLALIWASCRGWVKSQRHFTMHQSPQRVSWPNS